MKTKTIYLMRHGETDMNRSECLQGQIDCELNETGIAGAKRAAEILAAAGIHFTQVYTSPLKRAVRTAQEAAGSAEVTVEPLITEMHFGSYEGTRYTDIDPAMWAFIKDPENTPPPPGVESIASLTDRTGRFLRRVISDDTEGSILAVSHGIALRSMLWNLYPENERSRVWSMPIENCIIYAVSVTDGKVTDVRRAGELSQKNDTDTSGAF